MRAFFMATLLALLIGVPVAGAAAHDGWFVRVCSAKTRSGSHSLGVLRRPARIQLVLDQGPDPRRNRPPPRRFHSVARLTMRGSTASTPTNIQPHVYVCVGFRDHIIQRMGFDDHEDHAKNWNDTNDCAC